MQIYKVVEKTDLPDVFQSCVPLKQLYPLHKTVENECPFFVFLELEHALLFQKTHSGTVVARGETEILPLKAPEMVLNDKLLVASSIKKFWGDYFEMFRQEFYIKYTPYCQYTINNTYYTYQVTLTEIIREDLHAAYSL